MKIVKFKGGLGNQLFQYAFLRDLQLLYPEENVTADLSYYGSVLKDSIRKPRIELFNIIINKADKAEIKKTLIFPRYGNPMKLLYKVILFAEKTFNKSYYFEKNRETIDIQLLNRFSYFDGYWQSWRYVEPIAEYLKGELTPNFELSERTQNSIKKIKDENAVFIGIRRGDYLASKKSKKRFGSFPESYFIKGIEYIIKQVENPVFYLFSNDIEWVKKNMNLGVKINYREKSHQTSDIEELLIMSACKHAIIVNSTFYWWGAWLINSSNKIIIAPQNWYADKSPIDIIPDTWIKLQ